MSPISETRPRLAIWKFASCDGCQLTLLDCEDELLDVAENVEIAYFLEASSAPTSGPFDISLVEGSITTAHDVERIHQVRADSRALVTIGACATAGGIQALRNFTDVEELLSIVYATPSLISTLDTSSPISDHVPVDFELRGCPIDKGQLLELISATLAGRRPNVPTHSVCIECKKRGNTSPDSQRMHRVQEAWQHLRPRRARDTLPRSGHPHRLRSTLSYLQQGLLRVLWTHGIPQPRIAHRCLDRRWNARGRHRSHLSYLQRMV